MFIRVHGLAKVRPEVQDAMAVLLVLAELYASDAPADKCPLPGIGPVQLHPMPVLEGPRTYLEPCLEPGIHFHTAPDLATVRGFICAMDAGNPYVDSREQARGAEFVDDLEGMAAAIVQDVGGRAVSYSVMRGRQQFRRERRTPSTRQWSEFNGRVCHQRPLSACHGQSETLSRPVPRPGRTMRTRKHTV